MNPIFRSLRGLTVVVLMAAILFSAWSVSAAEAQQKATRIALVSDTHVVRGTNEAARLHPLRFSEVIGQVKAAQVDLVLISGDLTEGGQPWELREFKRRIKEFDRPVWFVAGNHDVGNKIVPGKKGGITFARQRDFELQMGKTFWVREAAGVRVIGLNSGLYGSGMGREDEMWKMMEKALATSNALPTIIVQHHPPFLKNLDEPGGDYFNMEPYPRMRLLALAKQGGVKAILSGHLHRSVTNEYQGVFLYTTPPVSFGLPKNKQAEGWTLVTVADGNVTAEFRPIPKIN